MKQLIDLSEYQGNDFVKTFIMLWKEKKRYPPDETLTIGQCLELLIATSFNFHKDFSDGRFFNNILINEESLVAWDGEEFIDILFHEVVKNINRRVGRGGTFHEEL